MCANKGGLIQAGGLIQGTQLMVSPPPLWGGKQDFGNYFPPLSETLGGFFYFPPIIWGNFGVSPPFWGVFANFSGFWGYFPPIIWDPGGK